MKTEDFRYKLGDQQFLGYLVWDDNKSGPRPGILVAHELFGVGEHVKERADRLAKLGYVALAVDMYGEGKAPRDFGEGMGMVMELRNHPHEFRARIQAAFDALAAVPQTDRERIAGIGYCFGGTTMLELARSGAPVRGVVSFHGGLETNSAAEPGTVKAKVMACTGYDDPFVPPAQVMAFAEEMKAAQVDFQILIYGNTRHSFTNPRAGDANNPALAYNEDSDNRSWAAMLDFFEEIF